MQKGKTTIIDISSFKKYDCNDTVTFIDDDIVIINNINALTKDEENAKLDCFMIIYCEEGYVECNINGVQRRLDNEQCAFLPIGTMLSPVSHKISPHNIKICVISKELINEILYINKETFKVLHYLYKNPIQTISKSRSYKQYLYKELLLTLMNEEEHIYSRQTRHYHILGILCETMAGISNIIPKNENIDVDKRQATYIVQEFFMMLNADGAKNRSVSYYADILCYSPKYLSYIIKSVTGKSPLQIINENAIVQIKSKLKHSNTSIKELAEYFNFPNPSFFCKFFKLHTGYTPLKFRQKLNEIK